MAGVQCKCKKGYVSGWDGKCANCRTEQETQEHNKAMAAMPISSIDTHAKYRFIRWGK